MRFFFLLGVWALAEAKPILTYFGVAGRGELARLIAVVGEVDIVDSTITEDYKTRKAVPTAY